MILSFSSFSAVLLVFEVLIVKSSILKATISNLGDFSDAEPTLTTINYPWATYPVNFLIQTTFSSWLLLRLFYIQDCQSSLHQLLHTPSMRLFAVEFYLSIPSSNSRPCPGVTWSDPRVWPTDSKFPYVSSHSGFISKLLDEVSPHTDKSLEWKRAQNTITNRT